ncbi:MAG: hypothetical protein HY525_20900 [Betaproteobacteria bacterium]|nr:hypothetical protein [Betaproteobacteria bacterium]
MQKSETLNSKPKTRNQGGTPDGHTILVVSSSFVVNPGLYAKIPYDPYKSFAPVSNMAASPNVFVAHPTVAAK